MCILQNLIISIVAILFATVFVVCLKADTNEKTNIDKCVLERLEKQPNTPVVNIKEYCKLKERM